MKVDPATGSVNPYPSQADQYRQYHGSVAWLINPWDGTKRDARDIGSDVLGQLIRVPGEPLTATPEAPASVPAIGTYWPAKGGIYAGIARGLDGEPDGHLVLLEDKPEGELNWADATRWAEALGDGARLPTRFEAALLYANLQDKVETGDWYWTSTQYSASSAWMQGFGHGSQDYGSKDYKGRARAVRRFVL